MTHHHHKRQRARRHRPLGRRPKTTGLRFSTLIRELRPELTEAFGHLRRQHKLVEPTLFDTAAVNPTEGESVETGRPDITKADSDDDAKTARSKGAVSTRNPAAGGTS